MLGLFGNLAEQLTVGILETTIIRMELSLLFDIALLPCGLIDMLEDKTKPSKNYHITWGLL